MKLEIAPSTVAIRDARPDDNAALVALAAACPMEGDMALCVEREPDFFALSRLEGDAWRTGVVEDSEGRAIACIGVARRPAYLHGAVAQIAYIGDLKVHPDHRNAGMANALQEWSGDVATDLVGAEGLILGTTLAGNVAVERASKKVAAERSPDHELAPAAMLRSFSIPLLWRRRLPRNGLRVVRATPDDVADMVALWKRVAPHRQLTPTYDAESFSRWIADAPGLELSDYLCARRADGELVGFLGLWNQDVFKRMRVTGYSPKLGRLRRLLNALAPVFRMPRLPAAGGLLRYRTVVNPCVAPDDVAVLRTLVLHAYAQLRGGGESVFTIGLDVRDPLTDALRGLMAQPTDVLVWVGHPTSVYSGPAFDDRPMHFEIALV